MSHCLDCDVVVPRGSRCARCERVYQQRRSAQRGGFGWIDTTRAVRARDGGCVEPGPHDGPLEVDHVRPLAAGGTNDLTNLRTLCQRHHRAREPWEAL